MVINMLTSMLLLTLLNILVTSSDLLTSSEIHHRQSRYLVYMPRGAYKFVIGLRIPMDTERDLDLSWTINYQFQYQLPINVTQYNLPYEVRSTGRSLRAINRNVVYELIEEYMDSHGTEGRSCLLRSICEAATSPLHYDGILGQLVQIVLTFQKQFHKQGQFVTKSRCAAILFLILFLLHEAVGEHTRTLSRKKRFLVFPDGAGLSVVYCFTFGTYLQTDIFTWGQTLGIGFELPTNSSFFLADHTSAQMHRMERRDVYSKLQILLDSKGMNGRSCILRAVCEAAKRTEPGSFLDTILRAVFTFPLSEGEGQSADEDHQEFDDAQWKGWTNQDCEKVYSDCSTSLIRLAFEKLDPYRKK